MKTKLILLLLVCVSTAHATINDLGAFDVRDFPLVFRNFINQQHAGLIFADSNRSIPWTDFDGSIHPAGWVSRFGELNGGVYMTAFLELSGPVPTTTISWDFSGLSDWYMQMILVEGLDSYMSHLYRATGIADEGSVTIDGSIPILQVDFYVSHTPTVPDNGATLILLMLGCGSLMALRRYESR